MIKQLLNLLFHVLSIAMKNVTYHLLVNLSVSDLMITCLCGPVHVIHSLVMGEQDDVLCIYKLNFLM